jgi:uncharacterized protein (TIGR02246 family)
MSEAPINRPEDVVVMFVDAWNHRDPDALAALFDTDAEFVNVTGLWWHTRDQIRSAHAYGLTRIFKDSSLRARHQSESVVGRDRGCPRAHDAHWPDVSGRDHRAATALECDVIRRPSDAGRPALRFGPQHRRRPGK